MFSDPVRFTGVLITDDSFVATFEEELITGNEEEMEWNASGSAWAWRPFKGLIVGSGR